MWPELLYCSITTGNTGTKHDHRNHEPLWVTAIPILRPRCELPTSIWQPAATELADSSSTHYIYPDEWAGRVAIGPNLNPYGSKIEGSFKNSAVDIDVSYVDGYSVPITCSSEGEAFTGCNLDLFKAPCENQVDGPVCLNPARDIADGPPAPFFAPCAGAAYTFPNDNGANRDGLSSFVSCCIGTSCAAPLRQLPNSTI
jgi:hypothetical protein